MSCVSGVLLFLAQQVLAGSQKERQKSWQGGNALRFLSRLELALLWKTVRNLLNRAEQISWLAEAVSERNSKSVGWGVFLVWWYCGWGSRQENGPWETAQTIASAAGAAKPWSWKGFLLLSESWARPGSAPVLLGLWAEVLGKEPRGCVLGSFKSAHKGKPRICRSF